MVDFSVPQPYNVPICEPEAADQTGKRAMPVPPVLYVAPVRPLIEEEADIYPERAHGIVGPRMRRVW